MARAPVVGFVAVMLASTAGIASGGCGPSAPAPAVGSSNASTGGVTTLPDGGTVSGPALNPVPADFLTSMTHVNTTRFLSRGHAGGRWDVEVYADPAAADALRGEHWPVPVGARFVEEHFERNDAGAGPVMMMEKRPAGYDPARGDWRYVAVTARGEVVKDGVLESCAGCHGEAPGDHVFRIGGEP